VETSCLHKSIGQDLGHERPSSGKTDGCDGEEKGPTEKCLGWAGRGGTNAKKHFGGEVVHYGLLRKRLSAVNRGR